MSSETPHSGSLEAPITTKKKCFCPNCSKSFVYPGNLSRHVKQEHHGLIPGNRGCGYCAKLLPSSNDLYEHIANAHCQPISDDSLCKTILAYMSHKNLQPHYQYQMRSRYSIHNMMPVEWKFSDNTHAFVCELAQTDIDILSNEDAKALVERAFSLTSTSRPTEIPSNAQIPPNCPINSDGTGLNFLNLPFHSGNQAPTFSTTTETQPYSQPGSSTFLGGHQPAFSAEGEAKTMDPYLFANVNADPPSENNSQNMNHSTDYYGESLGFDMGSTYGYSGV